MSDLNFDPPETHGVDYSERTDPDSGGGMNFVFYDQGQPGKNGQEKKKRPPADFGNPVRVKLSSQSADDDSDDEDDDASPAEDSTAPKFSLDMAASAPSAPKEDDEDDADEEDADDPVQVSLSEQATQPPPPSVTGQHLNITV